MKLLFYVSKLYSIPVVQPLIEEALKRNISLSLFTSAKVCRSLPKNMSRLRVFTNLADARNYNPDFVLCPGNFVDFRLPGIKIELFHGIGVEKLSHYRVRHFFDLYFTSGPTVTDRFIKLQEKHRYFGVVETGWPKMDHIVNYDTEGLRERMNIPKGNRVILYAPTHSRTMESASQLLPEIRRIMKPDETWMCKPHEFMGTKILEQMKSMQFRLISHYDITPYLHAADVLVSDTSSVVYEFMALDKPVITFRTHSREDKGINLTEAGQLRDAVDSCLETPGKFSENRTSHLRQVNPALDGTISKGIIDYLQTMDPSAIPPRGRKPLNLFRKLQILYHSTFKKGYMR